MLLRHVNLVVCGQMFGRRASDVAGLVTGADLSLSSSPRALRRCVTSSNAQTSFVVPPQKRALTARAPRDTVSKYHHYFDRNALASSVIVGSNVIALTRSGHMLRFDKASLALTAEQFLSRRARVMGGVDATSVLVGFGKHTRTIGSGSVHGAPKRPSFYRPRRASADRRRLEHATDDGADTRVARTANTLGFLADFGRTFKTCWRPIRPRYSVDRFRVPGRGGRALPRGRACPVRRVVDCS
jgi:hypothetical protein